MRINNLRTVFVLPRALLAGQVETARETVMHSEPDIPFTTATRDERQEIVGETGRTFAMDSYFFKTLTFHSS